MGNLEPDEDSRDVDAARSQLGELRDAIKALEGTSNELTNRIRDLVEGNSPETAPAKELEPVRRNAPIPFEVERIKRVNSRLQSAIQRIRRVG